MKTIRNKTKVIRVSDQEADKMVSTGEYSYCAKSVWKKLKEVKSEFVPAEGK